MGSSRNLRLLAVLLPFLVVMVFGVRDFGGAFFEQRKLGEAAFEGAKFAKAQGHKCARCWRVLEETDPDSHLCNRCTDAIGALEPA